MNRKLLLLIGASFLIASCGGSSNSNKQAAIDACSMDGGPMNKEVCTCFINSLEDTLNSDSFNALVDALAEGSEPPVDQFGMEEGLAFITSLGECGLDMGDL